MNESDERQVVSTSLNAIEHESFRALRRKMLCYDVAILTDSQVLKMAIELAHLYLEDDDGFDNMKRWR